MGYSATENNGNLLSQTITAPGINVTQNYLYDKMNRLCAAAEGGSVGPACTNAASGVWYEKFGYDQYGNHWISSHNLPSTLVNALTPTSNWYNAATNRVNGFDYDTAGNQTSAVTSNDWQITYDAENHMTAARYGTMYQGRWLTFTTPKGSA